MFSTVPEQACSGGRAIPLLAILLGTWLASDASCHVKAENGSTGALNASAEMSHFLIGVYGTRIFAYLL